MPGGNGAARRGPLDIAGQGLPRPEPQAPQGRAPLGVLACVREEAKVLTATRRADRKRAEDDFDELVGEDAATDDLADDGIVDDLEDEAGSQLEDDPLAEDPVEDGGDDPAP